MARTKHPQTVETDELYAAEDVLEKFPQSKMSVKHFMAKDGVYPPGHWRGAYPMGPPRSGQRPNPEEACFELNARAYHDYLDELAAKTWFAREFPAFPRLCIKITGDRGRSTWLAGGTDDHVHPLMTIGVRRVSMKTGAGESFRGELDLLHEIAHVAADSLGDVDMHGQHFRRAFVLIVRHQLGKDAARALKDALK